MPILASLGVGAIGAYRLFRGVAAVAVAANYIEDYFSTYLYTGNGTGQLIDNGISTGNVVSLVGKTITNLGGAFSGSYPITNINNGRLEISNATDIGYVQAPGLFDVYVDLGSPTIITSYLIAPQGTPDTAVFNTPTSFIVKASNDGSTWTTVSTFTSITTEYPNWNTGTYRTFSFSNSTAYRYWRLENTTTGSGNTGVAISEWSLGITSTNDALVWIKGRDASAYSNVIYDTKRGFGPTKAMYTNETEAQSVNAGYQNLTAFNTNGFSVGPSGSTPNLLNGNNVKFASWTFRKQTKFFDMVTYSGNGIAGRTIAHNLGSVPGCVIVKRYSGTGAWAVYHRGITSSENGSILLNSTGAWSSTSTVWNNTAPTSTNFTVGTSNDTNVNGELYVAYLFAHNAGGFGELDTDNVITCGSFTADSSGNAPAVNLGYEPQWILMKAVNNNQHWIIYDTMRFWSVTASAYLLPSSTSTEVLQGAQLPINPTGFGPSNGGWLTSETYIYIAIRRGPMKKPTSGTQVFKPITNLGNASSGSITGMGFAPDLLMGTPRNFNYSYFVNKLVGANRFLMGTNTGAETSTSSGQDFTSFNQDGFSFGTPYQTAWNNNATDSVMWNFRRAPGFFDIVTYTGNGLANRTVSHNLGVVPELIIVKTRNGDQATGDWIVYHKDLPEENANKKYWLILNSTAAAATSIYGGMFSGTSNQTATAFKFTNEEGFLGYYYYNFSSINYVAYLFASCPGVSKVGSLTNTGSTINVECGFTSGARFILLKRTNTTGGWFVYDSARGINPGTDPGLALNSTAAEYLISDDIDTYAGGFTFNGANFTQADYIFLAIA